MKKTFILPLIIATSLVTLPKASLAQDVSENFANQESETKLLAQATQAYTYDEYMELGYSAANEGNHANAAYYFRQALYLNPNDRAATIAYWNSRDAITQGANEGSTYDRYMEIAYDATDAGDYQTALQYFQQALQLRPSDYYATQAIRNVRTYLGAEDLPPSVGETAYDRYMRLAYAAQQEGNFAEAADYFRSALYENPQDRKATIGYWNAIDGMRDGEAGLGSEEVTSRYDRYMRRGYDATQRDNYERAIFYFRKALELRPGDGYALDAIDNVLSYMERAGLMLNETVIPQT